MHFFYTLKLIFVFLIITNEFKNTTGRSLLGSTKPVKEQQWQPKRFSRDMNDFKLPITHLNGLLSLYGEQQRKHSEISPEQRYLVQKDTYSDNNVDEADEKDGKHTVTGEEQLQVIATKRGTKIVREDDTEKNNNDDVLKRLGGGYSKWEQNEFDNLKTETKDEHLEKKEIVETKENGVLKADAVDQKTKENVKQWKSMLEPDAVQNDAIVEEEEKEDEEGDADADVEVDPVEAMKPQLEFRNANQAIRNTTAQSRKRNFKNQAVPQNVKQQIQKIAPKLENTTAELVKSQTAKNAAQSASNELSSIFDNTQLDLELANKACKLFKRVTQDIYTNRKQIRIGGLYDEYKKRLDGILSQSKRVRAIGVKKINIPLDYNGMQKSQRNAACPCAGADAVKKSEKSLKVVSKNHVKVRKQSGKPNKNITQKSKITLTKAKTNATVPQDAHKTVEMYNKKLEKQKSHENVVANPYFVPNSKYKQSSWNEIPLMPKVGSGASVTTKPTTATMTNANPNPNLQTFKLPIIDLGLNNTNAYPGINATYIKTALKAFENAPYKSLYDEYQKQLNILNDLLRAKQRWWIEARKVDTLRESLNTNIQQQQAVAATGRKLAPPYSNLQRRNVNHTDPQVISKTLEYALNQGALGQSGGSMLSNAASKMNMTPTELAQRLTDAGARTLEQNYAQLLRKYVENSAKPVVTLNTNQPPVSRNQVQTKRQEMAPSGVLTMNTPIPVTQPAPTPAPAPASMSTPSTTPAAPAVQTPAAFTNIAAILDKILVKLEILQQLKHQTDAYLLHPAEYYANHEPMPARSCCFENPTDGAPCKLIGSWESSFLGVRFVIAGDENSNQSLPCINNAASAAWLQRKRRWFHHNSATVKAARQCVKIGNITDDLETIKPLKISIMETMPPRAHEFLEYLADWKFNAFTANIVGGPLLITVRKMGTQLMGTFLGYCRTCGCIDTVFGSWTFCMPSKDCQDVSTAIFEKRDMLRRYKMNENRRERYKDLLFNKSIFSKQERERLEKLNKRSKRAEQFS